jgi:hypothetical protein
MSDPERRKPPAIPQPGQAANDLNLAREARLAVALRANLRRRKTGAKSSD